jgi:hypothetical protein
MLADRFKVAQDSRSGGSFFPGECPQYCNLQRLFGEIEKAYYTD